MLARLLLALSLLVPSVGLALSPGPAQAPGTDQRSPFTQGHWWDPSRSGSGFEIFNAADQAMVIWYTYEADGRPVWYTAQGSLADLGRNTNWALLKHRWADGRKQPAAEVGTLRLEVSNPEQIRVHWTIGSGSGRAEIVPFLVSGVRNEVDHTGSYFDPQNSGWGLTLTQQGDVLGGVLYTYDTSGAPTWVAGFGRDRDSVEMHAFLGKCPGCAYAPPTSRSTGRLGFEFRAEWQLALRNNLDIPMASGVNIDGVPLNQLSRPASTRPADRQLARFPNRAALKSFLDAAMLNTRASPAGVDFSPAPPASTFSATNLIETGVDEAALVKSDGRYVYTYAHSGATRNPLIRIGEVGADGATFRNVGQVGLNEGRPLSMQQAGLYLHGQQLVSVSSGQVFAYGSPWFYSGAWMNGKTHVEILSLARADAPVSRWRAEIDGYLLSSRRIGNRLYLFSRFVPSLPGFVYGSSNPAVVSANQSLLNNTPLSALLPKVRIGNGEASELIDAYQVHLPPMGARAPTADMILVTAIELGQSGVAETIAIVGGAEAVYASTQNLYVATSRYNNRTPFGTLVPSSLEPSTYTTDIHQIALLFDTLSVRASGSVEGYLGFDIDQQAFRMSEHAGKLRVVTSSNSWWGASVKNRLTVLEPSASASGVLRTVSYLPNAQRPESLGKPGELLYATRFVGERLYAVTFRQVDPLYVVDVSNAADPFIAGALEVPGFSEYLHPLPNGLLLGFGRSASDLGVIDGLQLSLFDVSDAGKPRLVQKAAIGKRGSDSALLKHHHAFSALTQPDGSITVAFPVRVYDGPPQGSPGTFSYWNWDHSGLARFEIRGASAATASLVQLATLVTHRASTYGTNFYPDAAADNARSILFRAGTVYIGNGQFWTQDTAGNTAGPY